MSHDTFSITEGKRLFLFNEGFPINILVVFTDIDSDNEEISVEITLPTAIFASGFSFEVEDGRVEDCGIKPIDARLLSVVCVFEIEFDYTEDVSGYFLIPVLGVKVEFSFDNDDDDFETILVNVAHEKTVEEIRRKLRLSS